MRLKFDKVFFIKFTAALLTSLLIMILSDHNILWSSFWSFLKIPPNYIPFSDFKAHSFFLECYENGINIYKEPCFLIPEGNSKITTHPHIWMHIFSIFNLKSDFNYNLAIFIILIIYFYLIFSLLKKKNSKKENFFLCILFLSKSNFLLIERLATDIIIFILVYLILIARHSFLKIFLMIIGFLLKYYPIFLISIFVKNKKIFFGLVIFSIIFISLFYLSNIFHINSAIVEMALPIAYGSRTMFKALYHLSMEYSFIINENNENFFRYLFILITFFYSAFFILLGYFKFKDVISNYEQFFIAGASIYIGTFIIGANADYRLIFLLLTISTIFKLNNKFIKFLFLFSFFLSFNSFYFLIGEKLSLIFFVSSSIAFLSKIIILTLLSLIIGVQLKSINFLTIINLRLR